MNPATKRRSGWVDDPEPTRPEKYDDALHKHDLPAMPAGRIDEGVSLRPVHPWEFPMETFMKASWFEQESETLLSALTSLQEKTAALTTDPATTSVRAINYRQTRELVVECLEQLQRLQELLQSEECSQSIKHDIALTAMRYADLRGHVGIRLHSQHLEAHHRQVDGNYKRSARGVTTLQQRTQSQTVFFQFVVDQSHIDLTKSGWLNRVKKAWEKLLPEGLRQFPDLSDKVPSDRSLHRLRQNKK